jgi:hypothetical protein
LTVLAIQVASPVDIAEGTITHLFEKLPSLQAGVLRKLALVRILFGHQLGKVGIVDAPALIGVLGGLGMMGSGMASLSCTVLIFAASGFCSPCMWLP